jgi:predicted Zn-dependent peptidase
MILYFMEDHEVPLVTISSVIRSGSVYDPVGKEGLAELTARVMRTGGTSEMTGSAVDEELEFLAAMVGVSMSRESGTASLSVLKKDLDAGLRIFSRILTAPVFEEDRLKLAKALKAEELKRIADDPQRLAFREFNRILYRNNARGRLPTPMSVKNIQREDLVSFHKRFFFPGNIMLSITGDITRDEAMSKIKQYLGDWRSPGERITDAEQPTKQKGHVYFLSKDVPQAVIIYGHLAPAGNTDDYYPFEVLDFIVGGGGFNSRVFQEVRNNRGLAYSTGSFYHGRSDYGVFGAYAMTKSESAADSLSLIRSILAEVKKSGVTSDEIERAKKSIINRFIFSFLSADQISFQQLMSEYDRLPDDYLVKFRDKIKNVRSGQLKEVAGNYLLGDDAVFFVLGEEKIFNQLLSQFGDIQRIEGTLTE